MFDGPDYLVRMHLGELLLQHAVYKIISTRSENANEVISFSDHCIELIRIDMMCNADTTPYLVLEDDTAPEGLRADFSSHHKCRNFEKIQSWMVEHTAIE